MSVKELVGGARRGLAYSFSLEKYVDRVRDQGGTQTCTGQAAARAAHVVMVRQAGASNPSDILFPSALAAYKLALEGDQGGDRLLDYDHGARPYVLFQELSRVGFVPETLAPFTEDPRVLGEPLDLFTLEEAAMARVSDYALLDSTGVDALDEGKAVLSAGYPICVAVQVDDAFENASSSAPLAPPRGKIHGGHYVTILGYYGDLFRGVNSWGEEWGDHGYFWLNAAAYEASTDRVAIRVVPALGEAA